jgi:NADH dehydrogenase
VAVRRPNEALFVKPYGVVGQVVPIQVTVRDDASCRRAIEGATAVVYCVGVLFSAGSNTFQAVQAEGPDRVSRIAAQLGVKRFALVSAIGADAGSNAAYARTKAAGEAAVHRHFPSAVILRPSIVFGPEDDFFNRFASLARVLPALPLIGGGHTKFQPVFVGDIAVAILRAAEGKAAAKTIYELGGPEVKSFRELMELVLREIGRKRLLLPIPFGLAKLQAFFLEMLPGKLLTRDQVELLKSDNIVSAEAEHDGRTLKGLGVQPTSMEAVLEGYLWRFRKAGQFTRLAA